MKKILFTLTGMNHYYGSEFLKKGMKVRLIKETDNEYDKEAIRVELKGLGKIGYVANSPYTVIGDSKSAGRMYDLMKRKAKGRIVLITIISARGTVGEIAIIPFPMAFNQSCYGLRAKKDIIDPTFLYYLVKYNVHILKKNTHGSVFDTITRDTFDGIYVDVPDMSEQLKIASILLEIDDKVELNDDVNDNLAA